MLATERAVNYLKDYMERNFSSAYNGRSNCEGWMHRIGITEAELEKLQTGNLLLDEPRFYKLLENCREYDFSGMQGKYPDWYIETPNWEIIGLVERTITVEKSSGEKISGIQGIVKMPTVIIDVPELYIEEGDILSRKIGADTEERLKVKGVISNRYQTGKPAYILTVGRSSAVMEETEKHSSYYVQGNNNTVVQGNSSSIGKSDDDIIAQARMGIFTWIWEKLKMLFKMLIWRK